MIVLKGKTEAELDAIMAQCNRAGRLRGLKEARDIVYGFAGKSDAKRQPTGIGPAWDAITARIAELEKGNPNG